MRQSDFEAGPDFADAISALERMPGGEAVAKALSDLQRRIKALENRDPGWRECPPADDGD